MPEEERVEGEAQARRVDLPVLTFELAPAHVRVEQLEGGGRAIVVGPVVAQFVLPLHEEGARQVSVGLAGGIEIAQEPNRELRRAAERLRRRNGR